MHAIYQNAQFTIIAAWGTDCEAGLPGVDSGSRSQLGQVVNVQGFRLAQQSTPMDIEMLSTYWLTRAWTFQEFLLSKRRLVFTESRIYFSCSHGIRSENSRAPAHNLVDQYRNGFNQSGLEFNLDLVLNWKVYAEIVSTYTAKHLTYEMDVLPAFAAIANKLSEELFGRTPFLQGIPLCMLDAGLLWRRCLSCDECNNSEDGLSRRESKTANPISPSNDDHIPSWSWAGKVGHIHYSDWVLQSENPSTTLLPRVTWLAGSGSVGSPLAKGVTGKPDSTWSGWEEWSSVATDVSEEGVYIRKGGNRQRYLCHPVETHDEQKTPMIPALGALCLKAEVASFIVCKRLYSGKGARRERTPMPVGDTYTIGPSHGNPLQIFDKKSLAKCGLAYDDYEIYKAFDLGPDDPIECNFVKLSQTTLSDKEDDPAYNPVTKRYEGIPGGPSVNPKAKPNDLRMYFSKEKYDWKVSWCMYNVLWVAWVNGIAYRVGIGKIHIHAFDNASPTQRDILLG
jgi:hypothetical protein